MKAYAMLASVTAVGVIVSAAGAPINQPARADVTLLSADDPLAGSDTAIILGGTTEPTPSTAFAQAVEDLYLHPLGFDDGATYSTVCDMVGTNPCSAPLQVLTTPELIQQGPSSLTAASDVVLAVENEFNADPGAFNAEHPLTVFGYSQSATAESIAMSRLAAAGIPSDDLHFVFIGDPSAPTGIWPNLEPALDATFGPSLANSIVTNLDLDGVLGNVTPDDLYPATIYTLDTDGVADFQQDFTAGGLLDPIVRLFVQHVEYLGLTPAQIADATTSTNSDLTYVDISDNINNLDAWIGAIEHGVASSGLFQSVLDSLLLNLGNMF
ncbi:PE-PPE domain-containing protein [Mycobacterium sp.]|uniref:PE-PPE domain-containing protein n=1 Tax=Mycobacterium sp. TaxID=1785 RepID=UPI0025DBEB03|nr:PE-PPE domain-containing protein [Mycobacterium sp.]